MVQQGTPLLVLRRFTKTNGVMLQRFPIDQQNIPVRFLQTMLQFVRNVAGHAGDNYLRKSESYFEVSLRAGFYI